MVCLGLEPGQQDGRRRQIHYGGTPKIFKIRNWNSQEMKIRGCVVASRPDRSATPNQRILRPLATASLGNNTSWDNSIADNSDKNFTDQILLISHPRKNF